MRQSTAPLTRPRALLGWMEGLADPTRLRLLRVLERQELGVAELCEVLKLPQSTVSRHLKVLADQGWLRNRRQGTANLYRIAGDLHSVPRRLWKLAHEEIESWPTVSQDDLRLEARLRARRDVTESFFSGAAADWDRMRAELYGASFEREVLLSMLPSPWTVADLGCGTGGLTALLARHVRHVIGVDQSAAMLRAARRRTADFDNVELHRSELEALPVADGSCDAALLVLVLTYVASVPAVIAEAARILKPGGRLAVVDLVLHDDDEFRRRLGQARLGFQVSSITALLSQAGLRVASARPLAPDPNAKGPALLLAQSEKPAVKPVSP